MRGIGSYTLGDQYTTPERRLSQMLTQQGSRGGPSHSWQETMGRLAQQLAGAYIGRQAQNRQAAADKTLTALEPDSYSMQPTMNDQQIMESEGIQSIIGRMNRGRPASDSDVADNVLNNARLTNTKNLMPQVQNTIQEETLGEWQGPQETAYGFRRLLRGVPQGAQKNRAEINGQGWDGSIDPQFAGIHEANSYRYPDMMAGGGKLYKMPQAKPDYETMLADEINAQREASEVRTLKDKMPHLEYVMQNLRGMENNPYAQRLLQGLMMNKLDRDETARLAGIDRAQKLEDAKKAFERKQMPMSSEQFEQKQNLIRPTRPQLITTAEGVYSINADGSKGVRVAAAPSQFGYPQGNVLASEQPQQTGGIPAGSAPWAGLPIKEQAKMQQSVYKDASKMLEKNRQSLVANKIMSDSFKRFKYLNEKQDKEAESEYFGTKTGSLLDRMPLGGLPSFDPDKIEMEKISSLLTPQMRQGMPGAASDRDVAMFANATVGINTPKEINDSLIAGMNARFENANDRQAFMEEFLSQNRHLNGAEQEWRGYLEANPIFDPDPAKEGQYVLNSNRQGYKEYFSGGKTQGRRQGDAPPPPSGFKVVN